jgi:hypothetical protein
MFHASPDGSLSYRPGAAANHCRVAGIQATICVDGVVKSSPVQCGENRTMRE